MLHRLELEETHRKRSDEINEAFLKTTKDSRGLHGTFASLVELDKKHNSRAYLDQLQAKVEQLTKFLASIANEITCRNHQKKLLGCLLTIMLLLHIRANKRNNA